MCNVGTLGYRYQLGNLPVPSQPRLALQPKVIARWIALSAQLNLVVSRQTTFVSVMHPPSGDISPISSSHILNTLRPEYRRDYTPEQNHITRLVNLDYFSWWSNITRKPLKGAATILRPRFSPSNTDTDPTFWEGWINWRIPSNPSTKVQPGWV